MSKLKVGVIGTGHLGKIHAKLWNDLDDVDLVGIFDTNAETANAISKELSCKSFSTQEELLKECDAVTIAVPTTNHYETALKCIEFGKHCLIEKPITSSYAEAQMLIKAAKDSGLLIQVGHVERFNPALSAIKHRLDKPLFIEVHRLSQFRPRAIDVSVIHDLMIHDIDIILWLIKSPVKKIDADGVSIITDTIDIANARIKFENGAVANITSSRISASPMRKMRLFQRNAYISIDFGKQDVEIFSILEDDEKPPYAVIPATMLGSIEAGLKNKNIYYEKPPIPSLNAIAEEQKAFISAINDKQPVAVAAEEAAEALKIAEEIQRQVNTR